MIFDAHCDIWTHVARKRLEGERDIMRNYHLNKFKESDINGGIFVVWVDPPYDKNPKYRTTQILFTLHNQTPHFVINILTVILFIGFIVDNIISSNIISSINVEENKLIKDNTEEITEKIKQVLRQKSWLHRRLINAYPGLKDIKVKIKKVEQKIDERRKRKE